MAKGKIADAYSLPEAGELPSQPNGKAARMAELDADPFTLVHNGDYYRYPPIQIAKVDEDDVVLKIPIAENYDVATGHCTTGSASLAGLENIFHAQAAPAGLVASTRLSGDGECGAPTKGRLKSTYGTASFAPQTISSQNEPGSATQTETSRAAGKAPLKPQSLKRRRGKQPVTPRDDDDDDEPTARTIGTHTFYVGDCDAYRNFCLGRFRELTMKPLRTIVTEWVKLLEPKRQRNYGAYALSKDEIQLPSEMPDGSYPPWWPPDIPYREPSHLRSDRLIPLAADFMLLHRQIDEESGKRRGSWISKLKQRAEYLVSTTPTEQFSSAKGAEFSVQMKERAMNFILPTLFDAAQAYEDHLAQYDLYEGTGNVDPGDGKHITWTRAPKIARSQPRKKQRRAKATRAPCVDPIPAEDDNTDVENINMNVPSTSFSSSLDSEEDAKVPLELLSAWSGNMSALSPLVTQPSAPVRTRPMVSSHLYTLADVAYNQSMSNHPPGGGQEDPNIGGTFDMAHFPAALPNYNFVFKQEEMEGMTGSIPTGNPESTPISLVQSSDFGGSVPQVMGPYAVELLKENSHPTKPTLNVFRGTGNPSVFHGYQYGLEQGTFTTMSVDPAMLAANDNGHHGLPLQYQG